MRIRRIFAVLLVAVLVVPLLMPMTGCRRIRNFSKKRIAPLNPLNWGKSDEDKEAAAMTDEAEATPETDEAEPMPRVEAPERPATTASAALERADTEFEQRNWDEALSLYVRAAELAADDPAQNLGTRVEAYAQIARCHLLLENRDVGRRYLSLAATLAEPDTQPLGWSRFLSVRGRYEWQSGDVESAEFTFKQMYDYCLQNGLYHRAVDAAHMVAIVAEPQEQIEWALKGINTAEQYGVNRWLGPLWNNLGWTYDEMGQHGNALDALKNARKYHYANSGELAKLIADYSIGVQHRKLGNIQEARNWLEPTLDWAQQLYDADASKEHAEWLGQVSRELAELELMVGNRKDARTHLERAVNMMREADMPQWDAAGFADLQSKLDALN